jgi:hypothetical protein
MMTSVPFRHVLRPMMCITCSMERRSTCMVHEMKVDRPIILEGIIGLHQPHLPHSAAAVPPLTVRVEVEPAVVSCGRASFSITDGLAWLFCHPGGVCVVSQPAPARRWYTSSYHRPPKWGGVGGGASRIPIICPVSTQRRSSFIGSLLARCAWLSSMTMWTDTSQTYL